MQFKISELALDEEFSKYDFPLKKGEKKKLTDLGKINIFVGANNCGKSRFLRKLSSCPLLFIPELTYEDQKLNFSDIFRQKNLFHDRMSAFFQSQGIIDADGILEKTKKIREISFLTQNEDTTRPFFDLLTHLCLLKKVSSVTSHQASHGYWDHLINPINSIAKESADALAKIRMCGDLKMSFHKVYIPTLRGLRTFAPGNDIYSEKTKQDYFNGPTEHQPEIFSGLKLYEQVKNLLLGSLKDRGVIDSFQKFISRSFFDNKPVALIPKPSQNHLDIKIGDEMERPVHELGDGIQAIITMTFPLFQHKDKNLLVYYEEPELFLHPGFLRMFLTALQSFPNHQYFLTTHSNHFLDIVLDSPDISVYAFRKELLDPESPERDARFEVELVNSNKGRVLELLGVRNSSVLLSNCTIWVEGITDRRYLSHYLKLYQKEHPELPSIREDLHFSFVEYSGGNITHWSFLDDVSDAINVDRLCGKLFLITDRDTDLDLRNKKTVRHEKLKGKLGERYVCLECREIENLLSPKVIRKVIESYERNPLNAPEFTRSAYQNLSLGEFIDNLFEPGTRQRKTSYAADSGTIKDKIGFCEKAIAATENWADLSEEAQNLTIKVDGFIRRNCR